MDPSPGSPEESVFQGVVGEALFRNHPRPAWIQRADSLRVLAMNPAALRRYRVDPSDLLSLTADRIGWSVEGLKASNDEGVRTGWGEHVSLDGESFPVHVTVRIVEGSRGNLELIVVWVGEGEGEDTDLGARESLFRQIAGSVAEAFWISTPEKDGVEYVSPGYRALWGRDPKELHRDPEAWIEAVHPDDRRRVVETVSGQQEGKYDLEYRIVRGDGEVRWVWYRAFPVLAEGGSVPRVVGVAQDITDRKELDGKRRKTHKMEAMGALSAGIAHDFNNILTVIRGWSALVREDLPEESGLREPVAEIHRQADRASALVRKLLAFSRKQILDEEVVDLTELVRGALPMLRRLVPPSVELSGPERDSPAWVWADPGELEQVFVNLVLNAAEAIPESGSVRLETAVTTLGPEDTERLPWHVEPGEYGEVRVADTGKGIDPEVLPRIFEPFFGTKAGAQASGLGLAMVYGTVKQSGGHILVESEPEQGAVFRVLLPTIQDEDRLV